MSAPVSRPESYTPSGPIRATTLLVALTALATPLAGVAAQVLEQRIAHPAPIASPQFEHFGQSVDISGDALIVGAPGLPFSFDHQHSGVAIYERVSGTWTLVFDKLQQYGPQQNAGWGVAIDGEWAAYGVTDVMHQSAAQGAVHVLHRDVGGWVETQVIPTPTPGFGDPDAFGADIDISGTLMAIGSSLQNQAFVYRLIGGTWIAETALNMPAGFMQAFSAFGESVAISQTPAREAAIVGQPAFDVGAFQTDDGAAHVFVNDPGGWDVVTSLPPSAAPSLKSEFGRHVALDGDVAAIGAARAFLSVTPFTENGGLVILRWNGSTFATSTTIVGEPEDWAGEAVAVEGDRVYDGRIAWLDIDNGAFALGRVAGQRWTGSAWTPWPATGGSFHRVESPMTDFYFGSALAASGGRLVVGAPYATVGGAFDAGAIHVINVAKEGWKWSDAQVGGLDTVVGSTGPARLIGEGSLGAGDGHRLHLHDAKPSTLITLFVGLTAINAPFKTGILVPNPQFTLYVPTNAAGDFHITTKFPKGVPPGISLWHHMWWLDAAAPAGLASSNAIRGITP